MIEKDTFYGLTNLKELYLNHCHLESIHPEAFNQTPNLTKLEICDNESKLQDAVLDNLKHLKSIIKLN